MAAKKRSVIERLCVVAALLNGAAAFAQPAPVSQDVTFLSLEKLAEALMPNVVRIESAEGEHGFGLIVGTDSRNLYIVTAKHVISPDDQKPPRGTIVVKPCVEPQSDRALKGELVAWHGAPDDVAFIRTPRPRQFVLNVRAIAEESTQALREATVAIGRNDTCQLHARDGRLSMLRDSHNNLSVELPNGLGGDSGGPVLTGRGVIGIVRNASETSLTLQSLAHVRELAWSVIPWTLEDSRNIPPTSPDAAHQDLTQTLNNYLWQLRNVHRLLLLPQVDRKRFTEYTNRYNEAIRHFSDVREKYDGTLNQYWGTDLLGNWQSLRGELWNLHQTFWQMNSVTEQIWKTGVTPEPARSQLVALEPGIQHLQDGIQHFTSELGVRRKDHATAGTDDTPPR